MKDEQIEYIRQLRKKRLCFVVCGQNVLAKSIVANELLARHLFPFKTENIDDERWRIVKIKVNNRLEFDLTSHPHFSHFFCLFFADF